MASRMALSRVLTATLRRPVTHTASFKSYYPAATTTSRPSHARWMSSKADESSTTANNSTTEDNKANSEDPKTAEENQQAEIPSEPSKEEQLEEQIKALKDQLVRSLADQENTRKIARNDVDAAKQYAIKSFAKSLLDVSDNLTRALDAVPKDEIEGNSTLKTLVEGIEMTERGLIKAFESNGLIGYGAPGETFDPNLHEALYEYPDPSQPAGTVGQVMKKGYMLNKRVLRPAEVGVIKKVG